MALDAPGRPVEASEVCTHTIMRYTWDRADGELMRPGGPYADRITVWCNACNEMLMQWIRDKGFSSWNRP